MADRRRETVRIEILTQLYGYRPQARDAERLAGFARRQGEIADATTAEFEVEAAYLCGKGLIERVPEEVAQDHLRYRITSAGIDFLESRGLV